MYQRHNDKPLQRVTQAANESGIGTCGEALWPLRRSSVIMHANAGGFFKPKQLNGRRGHKPRRMYQRQNDKPIRRVTRTTNESGIGTCGGALWPLRRAYVLRIVS